MSSMRQSLTARARLACRDERQTWVSTGAGITGSRCAANSGPEATPLQAVVAVERDQGACVEGEAAGCGGRGTMDVCAQCPGS